MRNILLAAGVAGVLGLFSACGGDDHAGVVDDGPTSGGKASGGRSSGSSGKATKPVGGEGGADAGDSLAPTVVITSPTEVTDPNEDGVLSGATVTVACSVTQSKVAGSSKVNESSVKIAMLGADGKVIDQKVGAPDKKDSEYTADFTLTGIPTGVVGFTCTAEDTSAKSNSDTVTSLLDQGPVITFVLPAMNSAHALSAPLDLEFTVEANPLTDGDDNAAVDDVTLDIVGQKIDIADAMDKPGHYRLQVDLADPKLFMPAPSGPAPVVVTATNKRTPTPVKATATQQIAVDGAGPVIKIVSPLDKNVVGGKVKLTFSATDAVSGVDPKTVSVALNMVDHKYDAKSDAWSFANDAYTFSFDSRQIKDSKVQITVNVSASDKVGNVSTGASELLYLDNYPPLVDLDPLPIRTISTSDKCSLAFDPVGDGAKNDLDHAAIAGLFRALVVDETNSTNEIKVKHFAGTNPGSVKLYLRSASDSPLLIDSDMDGVCDEVTQVESPNSLQFTVIPKAGSPWFGLGDETDAPSMASLKCTSQAGGTPERLCPEKDSDMRTVIQDEVNNAPIIYGVTPTPDAECTGTSWEFGTKLIADGWVCFAVRAVDNAGNVGVSRPIRICVDDPDRLGTPACANSSIDAPSCTDACTPPARLGNISFLFK